MPRFEATRSGCCGGFPPPAAPLGDWGAGSPPAHTCAATSPSRGEVLSEPPPLRGRSERQSRSGWGEQRSPTQPPHSYLRVAVCAVLAAVALGAAAGEDAPPPPIPAQAVAGPAAAAHRDAEPVEDPFPIRRLRASESQLPELLKQLDAGPLVRLPRSEF